MLFIGELQRQRYILFGNLLMGKVKRRTQRTDKPAQPVIFLHGFTGSASDWNGLINKLPDVFYPVAVDLPGHGKNLYPDKTDYYSTEAVVTGIHETVKKYEPVKPVLCGYSMGGRAALSFASKYPEMISALLLESSTPGIIARHERKERYSADINLAGQIIDKGITAFVDYWMNIPLFRSQKLLPRKILTEIRNRTLLNSPEGLAGSLKGFSTGIMPQLWDSPGKITCPVMLVTGGLDEKFCRINTEMAMIFPNAIHKIVNGAGHNIHLEKPEVFLNLLRGFLT